MSSNITDEATLDLMSPEEYAPFEREGGKTLTEWFMIDAHDCAGSDKDCTHMRHPLDRLLTEHYLIALGLKPDPKQCRAYDNLGRRKLRRNR